MKRPSNLGGQTEEFEDFELLNPRGREHLAEKYAHNAVAENLQINWGRIHFNRIALMNLLAARIGPACRYLEIGCAQNGLFSSMPLGHKVGVDPVSGGTMRMTSDAFFEQNEETFDLIFIDGLHTYEQVRKDIMNALKIIAPGGFIGMHDLIPVNWKQEHIPRINGAWTGDVWKAGVELAKTPEIDFRIFKIDHGVGLIQASDKKKQAMPVDMSDELAEARFGSFMRHYPDLPVLEWEEGRAWIEGTEEAAAVA